MLYFMKQSLSCFDGEYAVYPIIVKSCMTVVYALTWVLLRSRQK